jgi:2-aminoethylphosphonate-pyruvate transaminase
MIIFSPGPSNISARVRNALLAPDICHRDEEFTALLTAVRSKLLLIAGLSSDSGHAAVVLGGSGSVAIESMVAATRPFGRLLVAANGPYGERAAAMGRYHGVDVHELRLGWGDVITTDGLEAAITEAKANVVYLVHHETATGRLNDLASLAAVAKRRGCRVVVDTVSSIAGEALDIAGWGLDAVIGSSNKCLRGVPGAAFVIASDEFLIGAAAQRGAHYSNLASHHAAEVRGETPFTPPVHAMFALHEALDETLEEGVANRIAHYASVMHVLRRGLAEIGIGFLLEESAYGHTLISCHLPSGHSFSALHRAMKDKGYVIYAAQGPLAPTAFRLGIVGHFGIPEVRGFLDALGVHLR